MGQSLSSSSTPKPPTDEEIQAERRRLEYKIVSPETVKETARDPSCYWVDVRSEEEVTNPKLGYVATDKRWVFAPCQDDSCPILEVTAENMIPEKDAKIIVYCSSGRRAALAQETLERKGYKHVVNAGGLVDVFYPTKQR
jgi:phage shock protein E